MESKELLVLLKENQDVLKKNQDLIKILYSENENLVELNQELSEQNETWSIVSKSNTMIDMSEVAKVLNYNGYGRNKLFKFLREINVLRHNNQPYQKYVDNGCFKMIEQKVELPYGEILINKKTVASQKGLDFIRRKLDDFTK